MRSQASKLGRLWCVGPVVVLVFMAACKPGPQPAVQNLPTVPTGIAEISATSDKFPATIPAQTTPSSPEVGPTFPASSPGVSLPAGAGPGIEIYKIANPQLDLVVKSGAHWIRRNALPWSQVEPTEGARNWVALADFERELSSASSQGLQLVLIVSSAPDWAQKTNGYSCGPVAAKKLASFASFMHDVVARYSVAPYNVKYWELGNEPDIDPKLVQPDSLYGCWGDDKDAYYGGGNYAQMLKKVYPKIKAADPQAQVLVGGLLMDCDPTNPPQGKSCLPSHFLEGILREGGGDFFDGVSLHAYDYYIPPNAYKNPNWHSSSDTTGPVVIAKARYVQNLLAAYGHPDKFIMNTEAGLICNETGEEAACQTKDFQTTKASYIAQDNASALGEGLAANIWYSLEGWRGSALVDNQRQPLPAYTALQFNSAELLGAASVKEINGFSAVKAYELSKEGKRIWILWSLDGKDHPIQLPSPPQAVYDLFGASLSITQGLTVSQAPVYLEWAP